MIKVYIYIHDAEIFFKKYCITQDYANKFLLYG